MGWIEDRTVLLWKLAGVLVVFLVGNVTHIGYPLAGESLLVTWFVPVNESLWEHLKMGFWPPLLVGAVQYRWLAYRRNFLEAKALTSIVVPATILVLTYGSVAVLDAEPLVDPVTFLLACLVGQFASYRLLTTDRVPDEVRRPIFAAAVLLMVAFLVLTFVPPQLDLFRDPLTGSYGIP